MSYLVLARKYRPQTFDSVVGQEHVTRALKNALLRDRVPHALLFSGPRGVGKTTTARVISKALNCTGRALPTLEEVTSGTRSIEEVEPCDQCSNCAQITKGSNLAVQEIDGASNNSVENIRQIIDTLHTFAPSSIRYKIYIIDEVHMLSTSAFNALLKTLEEPPPNTIFIFATTEPHKVPDTVISRCQQYEFRRISMTDIVEQLRRVASKEEFSVDDDVLQLLARICQGGMRDASSLLDRVCSYADGRVTLEQAALALGLFDISHFAEIISHILEEREFEAIELLHHAFSSSVDIKSYVNDFLRTLRLLSLYSVAKSKGVAEKFLQLDEVSDAEAEVLARLAQSCSSDQARCLFETGLEVCQNALASPFPKMVLEAGVVRLAQVKSLLQLSEVIQQLSSQVALPEPSLRTASQGTAARSAQPSALKKKAVAESAISQSVASVDNQPAQRVSEEVSLAETSTSEVSEMQEDEGRSADGDLEWPGYLLYLKNAGEVRLDTFLRRVAPRRFTVLQGVGVLEFSAQDFLAQSCSDPQTLAHIKATLHSFSRIPTWNVTVHVHAQEIPQHTSSRPGPGRARHLPGSAEEASHVQRQKKLKRVQEEAANDVFVKEMLQVFEGAVIEKVTPVKQ